MECWNYSWRPLEVSIWTVKIQINNRVLTQVIIPWSESFFKDGRKISHIFWLWPEGRQLNGLVGGPLMIRVYICQGELSGYVYVRTSHQESMNTTSPVGLRRTWMCLKSQRLKYKVGQILPSTAGLAPSLQNARGRQLLATGQDLMRLQKAGCTSVKHSSKWQQNQSFQYVIN